MASSRCCRIVRAFTLIELLVVIAIIGILAAVMLPSLKSARERAQEARVASDANAVSIALELYYDDHKTWPLTNQGVVNTLSPTQWSSLMTALHPYLQQEVAPPLGAGYRYTYGAAVRGDTPVQSVVFDSASGYYACISLTEGYWIDFMRPRHTTQISSKDGGIDPWGMEKTVGTYVTRFTKSDCAALGL